MSQRTANEIWTGVSPGSSSVRLLLQRVWMTLMVWRQRRRERAELWSLDDRTLQDVGLTRSDVWREWRKPFWRE